MTDRRSCSNVACSIRMSCARANDEDYNEESANFCSGQDLGQSCSAFVLRKALGRENPDMVFTEARRRGRRHNAHAYSGPRVSFPGSEALFGVKLAEALRRKQRNKEGVNTLRRPDLMVTRYIRDGRNIKEE